MTPLDAQDAMMDLLVQTMSSGTSVASVDPAAPPSAGRRKQKHTKTSGKAGAWTQQEDDTLRAAVTRFQAVNGPDAAIRWKEIEEHYTAHPEESM